MVLLLASSLLFAGSWNGQRIFSVSSPEYRAIRDLYISQGMALPSTAGPWSAAELSMMLCRIDRTRLDESERSLYGYAWDKVHEDLRFTPDDDFSFSISLDADASLSLHSNPDAFQSPEEYGMSPRSMYGDYHLPKPLLSIPLETAIGGHVYGYTSLDLGTARAAHSLVDPVYDADGRIIGYRYDPSVVSHNLPFVAPNAFSDFNMNFPYRAFGSFGGSWWNVSIGRDRMSWGPGETGNFIIGDQVPYHNNARVSFFTDPFKYTFSMSAFIHPINYMVDPDGDGIWHFYPEFSQLREREGLRMLIAHRLEWRIFDRIGMALTEAIMYQNENGGLDPLVLSPTAVFHNYYIRGNANSILSLEIDYAAARHWNIYTQVAIDELQMPGEYTEAGTAPSAMGWMLGAKFSYPMGGGVLYGSMEAAYTDPYLYLRDDGSSYEGKKYGNSFIVAFPEFISDDSSNRKLSSYFLQSVGYRYSGDAAVINLNAGYEAFGSWWAEGNLMYMAHGAFDLLTRWMQVRPGTDDNPSSPSDREPSSGSYDLMDDPTRKDAVAHCLILTAQGGCTLIEDLSLSVRTDLILAWNKGNIGGGFDADFQITAGIAYSF